MASHASFSLAKRTNRLDTFRHSVYVFLPIATVFFLLRAWVRIRIQKAFLADDWVALIALFFFIGTGIWSMMQNRGRTQAELHTWELPIDGLVWGTKQFFYQQFLFIIGSSLIRISICMLLLRVIPANSVKYARAVRITTYSLMVFVTLIGFAYIVTSLENCKPISFFWHRIKGASGHCLDTTPVYTHVLQALSILSGLCDIMIALTPGVVIWQMNIRKREKVLAHGLMALGLVASIGNWVRYKYLGNALGFLDFAYTSLPLGTWSYVEGGLGLSAACAATLRPLLLKIKLPSFLKRKSNGEEGAAEEFDSKAQRAPNQMKSLTLMEEDVGQNA